MIRKIEANGKVVWRCKSCGHEEETPELEPPFYERDYENWGDHNG